MPGIERRLINGMTIPSAVIEFSERQTKCGPSGITVSHPFRRIKHAGKIRAPACSLSGAALAVDGSGIAVARASRRVSVSIFGVPFLKM